MNVLNDISDDEFVPFLHSLGVETYKKSFEWMLNDPEFAGVLRWLYENLDHNNALTAREEYRYNDLKKNGMLLSSDTLEASIESIKKQHPGISLPGDQETKESVKLEVSMLNERLSFLEKQENIVKNLIRQNDLTNKELSVEIARLNSAYQQSAENETTAAAECTSLAEELETISDGVIDAVAENFKMYSSWKEDKESATRFLTFNPLETYRQTQALFRSHFDLYFCKNLNNKQNEVTNEELRSALIEASNVEERLSDAVFEYILAKAELSGEQAKLALVTNYTNVHSSQITSCLLEAQSAVELLEQEENIVEQQMRNAVEHFVKARSDLAFDTAALAALKLRQQIQASITHSVEVWQKAFILDKLLYDSLRHELRTAKQFLLFAAQLRDYTVDEADAVASRIDSMNKICEEQAICLAKFQTSNPILQAVATILRVQPDDALMLVKKYNEFTASLTELEDSVEERFRRKENALVELKSSMEPLKAYIWSGCTKQPNSWDRTVSSLTHALKQQLGCVDKRVLEASGMFASIKNGDKQNLRKLWQWFLTDPVRLQAAMKACGSF